MVESNTYAGVIYYASKDDEADMKSAGVRFIGRQVRNVNGGMLREITISSEDLGRLSKHWGRFVWSLIPLGDVPNEK